MDHRFIPTLVSVGIFFFVVYALVFMGPLEKINAACTPFTVWPGNAISAGVRLGSEQSARSVEQRFDGYYNSCRRWLWNMAYDRQYKDMKALQSQQSQQSGLEQNDSVETPGNKSEGKGAKGK